MEGLRVLASEKFNEHRLRGEGAWGPGLQQLLFKPAISSFQHLKFNISSAGDVAYNSVLLSEFEVESEPEADDERLSLLLIPREDFGSLRISEECFRSVFKKFGFDPAALSLISQNSYGFHYFPPGRVAGGIANGCQTLFIGSVLYVLLWSYNTSNKTTKAMIIPRAGTGLRYAGQGTDTFAKFEKILSVYRDHVEDPRLLVFIAIVQILQWVDDFILEQLDSIRWLETRTGHGAFKSAEDIKRDIESITRWSRIVGYGEVVLANLSRHQQIAANLILAIRSWNEDEDLPRQPSTEGGKDELLKALPTLERQSENAKMYIEYLCDRYKSQSSVISGLLTHEDSLINIQLSESNKQIAILTKRDSSAMKTIAVMTMVFLPATFFAALFAVPSLQWNESPVIQHNFWIYWAFTGPSTILVFVIWLVITNWNTVSNWSAAKPQRRGKQDGVPKALEMDL